jgi:hypothetical protein
MTKHIGMPKHKRPNDNLYGAGEDSEKHAKPDAVLAAANTRAHAKAAEHPPPSSLPTHLSLSPMSHVQSQPFLAPVPYAQLHPMHASMMHFPVSPTYGFQYPSF